MGFNSAFKGLKERPKIHEFVTGMSDHKLLVIFDIHVSVHRDTVYENDQQDASCWSFSYIAYRHVSYSCH